MTAVIAGQQQEPVQPALAGAPPGGLDVQDVRARGGGRAGDQPGDDDLPLGAVPLPARPERNCDDGAWWCVETYDHTYAGWISIEQATLRSDNTVYAQLTLDVGPENVAQMAQQARRRARRSTSTAPYVPSIGLGAIAVSPLDMASAYATLAAGGVYSEPMAIRKVVLPNGEDTSAGWGKPKRKRVISDGVAYEVTQILEENVLDGTGVGARTTAGPRPARRDDRRPRRRVVLRLHAAARRRRSGSATRAARSR